MKAANTLGAASCPATMQPQIETAPSSFVLFVLSLAVLMLVALLVAALLHIRQTNNNYRSASPPFPQYPLARSTSPSPPTAPAPTDGTAPRVSNLRLHDQQAAFPAPLTKAKPPSSAGDATASPVILKSEETGYAGDASPECLASAMALAQRVRDLGLHLGEIVVSGVSIGLPNGVSGKAVFDPENLHALARGDNLIGVLPDTMIQAQLDRNVVQVHKGANGVRHRRPLSAAHEVIQLASRIGGFDLAKEYSISPAIVETLDTTYALAIAAGLEALRDAGLVEPPASSSSPATANTTPTSVASGAAPTPSSNAGGGTAGAGAASSGWKLKHEHRDETGVIFAASFPALDSLVEELARSMAARLDAVKAEARSAYLDELRALVAKRQAAAMAADEPIAAGGEASALAELVEWLAQPEAEAAVMNSGGASSSSSSAAAAPAAEAAAPAAAAPPSGPCYEFNRKLLFKLLVMANSQLAEIVQARGPNLHINAACAGTTAGIALGCDWLRAGRCKRVVVISADNPSSDQLLPWVGIGFLALGAACTKSKVEEAALPFDKRRNGMLLGAGAVGLVLETDSCAAAMAMSAAVSGRGLSPRAPLATILCVKHANSAYHASAIGVKHATELLESLLREVEVIHGLRRSEIASSLLYVSHETFTCARNGGCAGAEVTALRAAFGDELRKVLITNTKGITGHAMGVCFEDALAVAALTSGLAPPIVNHQEADPVLGSLRLSQGGRHECRYALHFAAGFGSQVTYALYRR